MANKITEITRQDIIDVFSIGFLDNETDQNIKYYWSGKLEETIFLSRLFDLRKLPSNDRRYSNAWDDINQHQVNNRDWDEDWVFYDKRFSIKTADDEVFLKFICESFHPAVREENKPWNKLLEIINKLLKIDGFELYEESHISGKKIYAWREISKTLVVKMQADSFALKFNSAYKDSQIKTVSDSIETNPSDAYEDKDFFDNAQNPNIEDLEAGEYYNLFVTGEEYAFKSNRFIIPIERALTEYIDESIATFFSKLTESVLSQIKTFPALFLNETNGEKTQEAYYGIITDIKIRENGINVYFQKLYPIPQAELVKLSGILAIERYEFTRTHWAIKNINLKEELADAGLVVSEAVKTAININTHIFDVSVTFAGENRTFVKEVVDSLVPRLPSDKVFYDDFYKAYLARPNLDALLQDIYHKRSNLIMVFLSTPYGDKEWCGLEFRAIKEIIKQKKYDKVMFIRMDDSNIEGIFSTDGYIDARNHLPKQIAEFALQRLQSLS